MSPRSDDQPTLAAPLPDPGAPGHADPEPRGSRYQKGELVDDRYRLVAMLGQGGVGEVWAAEHIDLKTEVAIKLFINAPDVDQAGMAEMLDRFRFEAQVSAQLCTRTRHIVKVHDAGSDARGPFLVMERLSGPALDELFAATGVLELGHLLALLEPIADAIDLAHEAGVVHRDLKPANILLSNEGGRQIAKLADFGIAKGVELKLALAEPKETAFGLVVGTPDYMSPERVAGNAVTPEADLWSLAALIYECLTGAVPFSGESHIQTMMAVATRPFEKISTVRPGLPAGIDDWFDIALHKDKSCRFGGAGEMLAALRAIADPNDVDPRVSSPPATSVSSPSASEVLPSSLRPSLPSIRAPLASVRSPSSSRRSVLPSRMSGRPSRPPVRSSPPPMRNPPSLPSPPSGRPPLAFEPGRSSTYQNAVSFGPAGGAEASVWSRYGRVIMLLLAANVLVIVAGFLVYRRGAIPPPRASTHALQVPLEARTEATSAEARGAPGLVESAAEAAGDAQTAPSIVLSADPRGQPVPTKSGKRRARPRSSGRDPSSTL